MRFTSKLLPMFIARLLIILGLLSATSTMAHDLRPLPKVGNGIPVNVLLCKTIADMQTVLLTAYEQDKPTADAWIEQMKQEKRCEMGGGARIIAVEAEPFISREHRAIHILTVQFGGQTYYANFNR